MSTRALRSRSGLPALRVRPDVEFRVLRPRTVLNRNRNPKLDFFWTINPYRGCEFGCRYCYARTTHEYLSHPGEDFERRIFVKEGAADVLRETLSPKVLEGRTVAIGTATDPYQAAEIRYGVTRRILEVLSDAPNLTLAITTKSPLVTRDIDLLRRLAARRPVRINMTITTLDRRLARELEHRAPSPRRRLEAISRLREAGIETALFCCPILPGLTDGEPELSALLRAARSAGASYAVGSLLHLEEVPKRVFFELLRRKHPALLPRYETLYGRSRYGEEAERTRIRDLFATVVREIGFPEWKPVSAGEEAFRGRSPGEQLRLWS